MAPRHVDDRLEQLRAALAELAAQDLPEVLIDARREARERAKAALADVLTDAMLDQAQAELGKQEQHTPTRRERPKRSPTSARSPAPTPAPTSARSPAPTPAPPPRRDNLAGGHGLYLYCVVSADTELPADLAGIEPSHPPTLIRHDGVAAVASKVPLEDFEEDQLRQRLGDMGWVEKTARAHEQALERIGDTTTLIPMRMCSVYKNERGVLQMLEREADAFEEALRDLHGKSEWGVKVFADDGAPATTQDEPEDATGADYMRRRQSERDARLEANEQLREAAALIHEQLADLAADALSAPLQRPEVSGHGGEMLHNGAYLVDDGRLEEFLAAVESLGDEHRAEGLQLEPTGPWPAYNFVPGTIGAAW